MIEKKATIDGREYTFRCSALIPKLYRVRFERDMVMDMSELAEAYKQRQKDETKTIPVSALEVFENVSWLMLKYAGEDVGDNPDEWLENLDGIFSVYEAMPVVLELWKANNKTTSVPKKK